MDFTAPELPAVCEFCLSPQLFCERSMVSSYGIISSHTLHIMASSIWYYRQYESIILASLTSYGKKKFKYLLHPVFLLVMVA
jgi:hypothetical protein